ncbi:UNVERIFIED_CONTAM: hypothetical protein GTU68_056474 [Idotea baltica]|nr:hypothetical protein [Idotea baltica]
MPEITFNGEPKTVESSTVQLLIEELQLGAKRFAVERNKEIVPRSQFAETEVAAGDVIEIVQFVGGG